MIAATRAHIHLHFLVLIWGFTAILGLLITIPSVETVWYRTLFSSIGLALLMYFRHISFRVGFMEGSKLFATGFLIAAHWILFFWSARVSNASVCLAGMATTSFWTSFLEPMMNSRKIKWFEVGLGLLVILGLYVIFRFEFSHAVGLIMALGSALIAALFTVINARFTLRQNHYTITFYEMAGAFIGTVIFMPLYRATLAEGQQIRLSITTLDLVYLLILALVCTVYAYSASIELMRRISAFVVNLTVNLEPVYGIILAALIFGESEKMHMGFYIGAAIILLSVLAHPLLNKQYLRRQLGEKLIENL
jgi:drug/metabolite transporter (DMT)-like permease